VTHTPVAATCPDDLRHDGLEGCGSGNVDGPDFEGLYDPLEWWQPEPAIARATGQEEEALSAALDEAIEVVSDLTPGLNAAMAPVCTRTECDGTNLDPTATTCRDCSASDHAEGATQ